MSRHSPGERREGEHRLLLTMANLIRGINLRREEKSEQGSVECGYTVDGGRCSGAGRQSRFDH